MMKSDRKIRPLLPAAATAVLLCICIISSSIVVAVGNQPDVVTPAPAAAGAAAVQSAPARAAEPAMEVELLAVQEETTFPATVLAQPAQPLPISEEDLRQMAANAEAEAAEAEAEAEPAVPDDLVLVDYFTATAYCTTGTTATGTYTTVDRTLAVNPSMIPYGTHVWLFLQDGTLVGDFYAEDTGSNMMAHPYVIDIYKGADSYDECIQWGAQPVSVYVSASETN